MRVLATRDKSKTHDVAKELSELAEQMRKIPAGPPPEDDADGYFAKFSLRMFGKLPRTRVITDADRKSTWLTRALAQIKANLR